MLLVIFADLFSCSHVVTQDVADQLLSHIYNQNMCFDAVKTHDNQKKNKHLGIMTLLVHLLKKKNNKTFFFLLSLFFP